MTNNFIRAYLRASTDEQDPKRAKDSLTDFAKQHNRTIASYYIENESGAKLDRPELNRLLSDCQKGDILLVESIDRLSRLTADDWATLKGRIGELGVRIVALDLPTSHNALQPLNETTDGILTAVNTMMIELMAVFARKDYEMRRVRQAQGIKKAKEQGKYKGRPADTAKHKEILELRAKGHSIRKTAKYAGCSVDTVVRVLRNSE